MYILGINGGVRHGYQDVSATLIKDGEVIFAVEEERLNRIKFSPGQLPELAIYECLKYAGIRIQDIDYIASHGSTWGDEYAAKLRQYFLFTFGHCPKLEFVHHHDAHAASAYYGSGFDEAMVVTIDASGDGISTQLAIGKGSEIQIIKRFSRPDSIGIFFSILTQFCGFRRDSDEYKLMGLAAYGNRDRFDFSDIISFKDGVYHFDESFLKPIPAGASQPIRQEMAFSEKLLEKLGPKRLKEQEITTLYKDVAASAQKHLEDIIVDLITHFQKETGVRKLCLAGGVALNCLVNQKLMNLPCIDEIYVQPAASDAGISMGAAMSVSSKYGIRPLSITSALLGMEYSDEQIQKVLDDIGVKYHQVVDPALVAVQAIAENKVIGWFQGRMEFGPRALGARSILANPAMKDVKNILNQKIKYRESYRPFCPSVTEEDAKTYFIGKSSIAPFMNITFGVAESMKNKVPGIVHADGTARIQTVSKNSQPLYHRLLEKLKELTGHAVVVNTSFNTNNEPIVATPYDAVATFYRSGIDVLVIGNFVLEKERS
ncbi:MAG: carbamoyltransferase C-terminal domain-containing protein [Bacteroidota bacterium]